MEHNYLDCFARWEESGLRIGNESFVRTYPVCAGHLAAGELLLEDGYAWRGFTPGKMTYTGSVEDMTVTMETDDRDGQSMQHLKVTLHFCNERYDFDRVLRIFPKLPFMSTEIYVRRCDADGAAAAAVSVNTAIEREEQAEKTVMCRKDAVDVFPIASKHIKVEEITLRDRTDHNDWLVKRSEDSLYFGGRYRGCGNMFLVRDYLAGKTLVIIREAPVYPEASAVNGADLWQEDDYLQLCGTGIDRLPVEQPCEGYGATVGLCDEDEVWELYQQYYRVQTHGNRRNMGKMMSNTWGDRNRDGAVCHEFILRELEVAHELGLDVLQIDDGWQKGKTANSVFKNELAWGYYYENDPEFWAVDPQRFPLGLEPIFRKAEEYSIELGLWFSPDMSGGYANWRRDADVILSLHRRYGVRCFKLDGICLDNKEMEANYLRFLHAVRHESEGKVSFNQDITAQTRLGYLYESKYHGTLFVENRYTDWGRYFPHATLRNLWELSAIFPSQRFQFEVLNNKRNAHLYQCDPLAPANYDIDYLFASVMTASPLIWMELTGLAQEEKQRLRSIIAVFKQHRDAFADARILPIGQSPDGTGHTGFQIRVNDTEGYLILLREWNKAAEYPYALNGGKDQKTVCTLEVLHTNCNAPAVQRVQADASGKFPFVVDKPFGYVFARYSLAEEKTV